MIVARDLRGSSRGVDLLPKLLPSLPPLLSMAAPRFRESSLALLDLLAQSLLLFSPFRLHLAQPRLPRIQQFSDASLGFRPVVHCLLSSLLPNRGAEAGPRPLLAGAERSADLLPVRPNRNSLSHEVALPVRKRSVNPMATRERRERRIGRQPVPRFEKVRRELACCQSRWTILGCLDNVRQSTLTDARGVCGEGRMPTSMLRAA